jgi:hypothetical protein
LGSDPNFIFLTHQRINNLHTPSARLLRLGIERLTAPGSLTVVGVA